jgi:phosphoribosyl-ATP pyrophosphohydrolase/phosphoribosyl-AMP cyclohydrolase/histidinol dehydrogenase
MSAPLLRRVPAAEVPALRRGAVDAATLTAAAVLVDDVRTRGEAAVREHAERLGDLKPGEPLVRPKKELDAAAKALSKDDRDLLKRTAKRIRAFAEAQLEALGEVAVEIPGGAAGHVVEPVERAGCYAPGGRFPLPSSVLMTVIPARVAGVDTVWVASPRPTPLTLAAASIADANGVLAVGGAQAIAALAFGAGKVPAADVVVGPGNRWVTAAKQLVAGHVGIDMLAGPSELVIVADADADPALVAADLLAQAEHDPDALPILVSLADEAWVAKVDRALAKQLADLPTAATARAALANGYAVLAPDADAAVAVCDRLAPEHLQLLTADADELAVRVRHYGALFVGPLSAEVLGDYGAGPNHTLPTGGTARSIGGLSVDAFLRTRTWLRLDDPQEARQLVDDAVRLARLEGLEAHARAAERRRA